MVIRRQPASPHRPQRRCGDGRLPTIEALAALGPLLCFSRTRDTLLSGWRRAVRCEYGARVDSNGLRECLRFHAADGECCWRLYALPEDDFLAWERLIAIVPARSDDDALPCLAERLWREWSDALLGKRWRASLIRIHAFHGRDGGEQRCLAVSVPTVSPFSVKVAQRIARAEAAELSASDMTSLPQGRAGTGRMTPVRPRSDSFPPFTTGLPT
ncbi:MAG: Hemin transport protein [Pseudomonadota bacterium]